MKWVIEFFIPCVVCHIPIFPLYFVTRVKIFTTQILEQFFLLIADRYFDCECENEFVTLFILLLKKKNKKAFQILIEEQSSWTGILLADILKSCTELYPKIFFQGGVIFQKLILPSKQGIAWPTPGADRNLCVHLLLVFMVLAIWFKWTLKKPAAVAHGWSNLTDPIGPFSLFQHILPGYLSVPLHSFCICSVVAVIIPPLCLRIMLCLCIPIA